MVCCDIFSHGKGKFMERTITVRGVGNISAKPDFIVIEMDIRGRTKNYSEALADASSAV